MDNIAETANSMATQLSQLIQDTAKYKEYQEAKKAIHDDPILYKKVMDFMAKHIAFLYAMRDGTAPFEQERYLSQEFHKLMLNRNVYIYLTTSLEFIEMMASLFTTTVKDLDVDLDF